MFRYRLLERQALSSVAKLTLSTIKTLTTFADVNAPKSEPAWHATVAVRRCRPRPASSACSHRRAGRLPSVEHVVPEVLHLKDCSVWPAGERFVEMRRDNLADNDVMISLLDNRRHTALDRAGNID